MEVKQEYVNRLPLPLIHIILNYTDVVVYRHGKYINRISNTDERRDLLRKIPRPVKELRNHAQILLLNKDGTKGYYLVYTFIGPLDESRKGYTLLSISAQEKHPTRNVYRPVSCKEYIFTTNNTWHLIHNYTM